MQKTHIVKPGLTKLYHHQVRYWLWKPATDTVIQSLAIQRGQIAMAVGRVSADSNSFELVGTRETESHDICSNPFLGHAFKTVEFRNKVDINTNGTWYYHEDTVMMIRGQTEPFHHTVNNTVTKIGEPMPNPLALR